jgi:hypothetical protein
MSRRHPPRSLRAALLVGISLGACGDDPAEPAGDPPHLPPLSSMQVETAMFEDTEGSTAPAAAAVGANFLTAAVSVTVARSATIVVMAIPVATFAAAASNTPVFEDGAFHWRYAVQESGQTFEADLSGQGQGTQSIWEMRITSSATTPPLDDFLWYAGRAALSGEDGEWHVYDAQQPSSRTEMLDIDWAHPTEDAWTLTFTNVNPVAATVGDRLEYEVDGDLRAVRYFDSSENEEIEVEWNAATRTGSIVAPNYNNGMRACWDADFENVPCS